MLFTQFAGLNNFELYACHQTVGIGSIEFKEAIHFSIHTHKQTHDNSYPFSILRPISSFDTEMRGRILQFMSECAMVKGCTHHFSFRFLIVENSMSFSCLVFFFRVFFLFESYSRVMISFF